MTADRISALLEPIQNRLNAATPGPWHQGRDSNRWENSTEVYSEREVSATSRDICTSISRPEDAALIAAAPTDQARLLAAVKAVSKLHQPEHHYLGANYKDACAACRETWPCPTVSAVVAALGGEA